MMLCQIYLEFLTSRYYKIKLTLGIPYSYSVTAWMVTVANTVFHLISFHSPGGAVYMNTVQLQGNSDSELFYTYQI